MSKYMIYVMTLFMLALIYRTWLQVRRNGETARVLKMMQYFTDEEKFFEVANTEIENQKSPEFKAKAMILRMFGESHYLRKEQFLNDLQALDVPSLYAKNQKVNLDLNEDSFFYLYLAIPNNLYANVETDLLPPLYEKLGEYDDVLEPLLVVQLGKAARKYYLKEGDHGAGFFNALLEGEYPGLRYSKQLIGIYKNIATALLARIALDDGNQEKFEEYLPDLRSFAQSSGLGNRWIRELSIELPDVPEDNEETEPEPEGEPETLPDDYEHVSETLPEGIEQNKEPEPETLPDGVEHHEEEKQ